METFKEKYESSLGIEIRSETHLVVRYQTFLSNVHKAASLLAQIEALPSSEDVSSVSLSYSYADDADSEVILWLNPNKRESSLVRDLAQLFHVTVRKSKHWDEQSLDAEALVDRVRLKVSGYKPATCRIVEEVVDVPAQPATTKIVKRIVCDESQEPDADLLTHEPPIV